MTRTKDQISSVEIAIRENRIAANEGRDEDGDLVYRDGKPHPASGLTEVPAMMAKALEVRDV
jgi:hypothetical protein